MASSRLLPQLPLELEERILQALPANEKAATLRLVCKFLAERYSHCSTIHLSQVVPQQAFAHQWHIESAAWSFLPLARRRHLLALTAATGDLPNLAVAINGAGCLPVSQIFEAAAAAGHIHICQHLHKCGCPHGRGLTAAAKAGHLHVVQWLVESGDRLDWADAFSALRGGHVELAEWILRQLPAAPQQRYYSLLTAGAAGCDLTTLEHLFHNLLQRSSQQPHHWQRQHQANMSILAEAARSETPDWRAKVLWLESLGCPRNTQPCERVACMCTGAGTGTGMKTGTAAARLAWLLQRGYPANSWVVCAAAGAGDLAAVEVLVQELGPASLSSEAARSAADGGHLHVLRFFHERACPFSSVGDAVIGAAAAGHLPVVAWLVETLGVNVAELGKAVVSAAARSGNVELLVWLRERGCGWDEGAVQAAAEGGCAAALQWLVENGCPMPCDGVPYTLAVSHGDLLTLRCLRRLGCPWGSAATFAACAKSSTRPAFLPLLRWLVEAGCPMDLDKEELRRAYGEGRRKGTWWIPQAVVEGLEELRCG